jgi:hypothetical protein
MRDLRPRTSFLGIAAVALVLVAILALLSACSGDDDGGDSIGTPAESNGSAVKTSGPSATIPYSHLPAGYPEGFPLYPGSSLGQTVNYQGQVHATLESDDAAEVVAAYYRTVISEAPWEALAETTDAVQGVILLRFRNTTDGITGTVTITAVTGTVEAGRSHIGLVPVVSSAATPGPSAFNAVPVANDRPEVLRLRHWAVGQLPAA